MAAFKPQVLNPPDTHLPKPTYSHISRTPLSQSATLVTIAGQIGMKASGEVPADFTGQVAVAMENLSRCLQAAGATFRDIVKVTHYIVNYDPKDRSRAEFYTRFLGDHRPPSTLVGVAALAEPELLYEIEAMAVVHSTGEESQSA